MMVKKNVGLMFMISLIKNNFILCKIVLDFLLNIYYNDYSYESNKTD